MIKAMTMTKPLIIGAGPTGLAAALFLHERGICARVVDAAVEPAPWSKALGVNSRTLALLEPSGVTAAIIAEGLAVERVYVSQAGRPSATIPLDYAAVGARRPLTILPQRQIYLQAMPLGSICRVAGAVQLILHTKATRPPIGD